MAVVAAARTTSAVTNTSAALERMHSLNMHLINVVQGSERAQKRRPPLKLSSKLRQLKLAPACQMAA